MVVLCLKLRINLRLKQVYHRKQYCMSEIKEYTGKLFADIQHIDEHGSKYWLTNEL